MPLLNLTVFYEFPTVTRVKWSSPFIYNYYIWQFDTISRFYSCVPRMIHYLHYVLKYVTNLQYYIGNGSYKQILNHIHPKHKLCQQILFGTVFENNKILCLWFGKMPRLNAKVTSEDFKAVVSKINEHSPNTSDWIKKKIFVN